MTEPLIVAALLITCLALTGELIRRRRAHQHQHDDDWVQIRNNPTYGPQTSHWPDHPVPEGTYRKEQP